MRKSTTFHYSEGDVKKIIKDEFKTAKKDIIQEVTKHVTESVTRNVTDSVTKNVSESISEKFDQKITLFKNEIITLIDKIMGELKAIREEQTIIVSYKDHIEDHETRIGKLEEVLEPNPITS